MAKVKYKKVFWPAISCVLMYAFINLSLYITLTQLKLPFPIYTVLIIVTIIAPPLLLFLELLGLRDKLWSFWKDIPTVIHQIICLVCSFWIGYICYSLVPSIKNDYEKS